MKGGRRWPVVVVALCVALAAGWLAGHAAHRTLPPPVWAESDLPALAAASEDGWTLLTAAHTSRGSRVDTQETQLCQPDRSATFAAVLDRTTEIRAALDAPAGLGERATAGAVFGRPRLTDHCPVDPGADCPWIALHHLHGVAELEALSMALGGDWEGALASAVRLLRLDLDLLVHARGLVALMVALADARHAVALAGLLADGLGRPPEGASAPPPRAELATRLRALRDAVVSLGSADVDARRVVLVEYLMQRAEIEWVIDRPAALDASPAKAALFFDARATAVVVDEHARALFRYAGHPSGAAPPPLSARANNLPWRLWNPVGRLFLDTQPDAARQVREFAAGRAALTRSCDALAPRLRALLE